MTLLGQASIHVRAGGDPRVLALALHIPPPLLDCIQSIQIHPHHSVEFIRFFYEKNCLLIFTVCVKTQFTALIHSVRVLRPRKVALKCRAVFPKLVVKIKTSDIREWVGSTLSNDIINVPFSIQRLFSVAGSALIIHNYDLGFFGRVRYRTHLRRAWKGIGWKKVKSAGADQSLPLASQLPRKNARCATTITSDQINRF